MMSKFRLNATQLSDYERDGFLKVENLFSPEEVALISSWAKELQDLPETPGKQMMYFEQSLSRSSDRLLNRIENFCPFHEPFNELMHRSQLVDCVEQLLGEPAVLFKEKINFKMPGGDGFTPHQDVQAGWDVYADLHVTGLVSIDAATVDNGCLEIAAGHHKRGMIGECWRPMNDRELEGVEFVPCETQPGDAVFFDSFVPHRSGPNRSLSPRRVLYVTYNKASDGDSRERYYAEKRASYPPDCEREQGKSYAYKV